MLAVLPLLSEAVKVPAVCTGLGEPVPESVAAVLVLLGGSVENETVDRTGPAGVELLQPASSATTMSAVPSETALLRMPGSVVCRLPNRGDTLISPYPNSAG